MKTIACLLSVLLFVAHSYGEPYCVSVSSTKAVQGMNDAELAGALASKDSHLASEAVREIMCRGEKMFPALIALEGCRTSFFGSGLGNPMSAQLIPRHTARDLKAIPAEQAALYLIEAIYRGSLGFAQSPYLIDQELPQGSRPASTSIELNRRAWESVRAWFSEYLKRGLAHMRRSSKDPLSDARVAFW